MKSLDLSEKLLLDQYHSAYKNHNFDEAIHYIRDLIQRHEKRNDARSMAVLRIFRSFAYLSLPDFDRTIADAEKDIEHRGLANS